MNEDFRNYLNDHLVVGGCGINANKSEETKVSEPVDLNEECEDDITEDETEADEPVTTEPTAPKIKTSDKGTYHGFFLAPVNHLQRITDALTKMAETDDELAKAIAEGKKTFEGCDRYIRNNMGDLAKEMGTREITFDDDTVHQIARYYMVNPDNLDASSVAKAVKTKKEPKPKAEPKKKEEPKAEVVDMFADFFK